MLIRQVVVGPSDLTARQFAPLADCKPDLLFVFGAPAFFADGRLPGLLEDTLPGARRIGCSTAGEIHGKGVSDGRLVATAVRFGAPVQFRVGSTRLGGAEDSAAAGRRLGQQLAAPELHAVIVFAPGVQINGSALIEGLQGAVGPGVRLTGGLAGDGGAFQRTFVLCDEEASDRLVSAIGFYGPGLSFRHGTFGGWRPFGPVRRVTRCEGNRLYELDGEPALAIYKRYLGEYASGLPSAGLLFPFAVLDEDSDETGLIRTIIGVDEPAGALVFAGDIPQDGAVRLMQAGTDALVDGAQAAAEAAVLGAGGGHEGLALLVSCVGRKLVMGGRVDEEVEAVAGVLGKGVSVAGFYSYGEISPFHTGTDCRLHNQTMTITYLTAA